LNIVYRCCFAKKLIEYLDAVLYKKKKGVNDECIKRGWISIYINICKPKNK